MPCQSDEEFAHGPEQPNAVTLPRRRCNAGACRDKSDAENLEENDSDADADDDWGEQPYISSADPEKRKRVREILVRTTVKTWVTGERARISNINLNW